MGIKFRWPFAWKSTAEAWEKLFLDAWGRMSNGYANAHEWSNKAKELQAQVRELIDLEHLSPKTLGVIFSEWDSEKQAEFFNTFEATSRKWHRNRCFQWPYVMEEMTPEAKEMLVELADYAK